MKAFVTGGSGFIGGHVVRKLLERGYEVTALVRSGKRAGLQAAGARVVAGDIGEQPSMRAGMLGNDVVFHLAGWYKIGSRNPREGEIVNVEGTRNVLELAHELGIPKIIYTSTVAVFGDTHGQMRNETYRYDGPFLTEYDRTKWLAHYEVAVPLIRAGAPIVIVMPGGVYGPGDTSVISELMERFYRHRLPLIPGPETALTYAHVEDIAEGHVLAAERGVVGESYILAGRALALGPTVNLWARILHHPRPPACACRPAGCGRWPR